MSDGGPVLRNACERSKAAEEARAAEEKKNESKEDQRSLSKSPKDHPRDDDAGASSREEGGSKEGAGITPTGGRKGKNSAGGKLSAAVKKKKKKKKKTLRPAPKQRKKRGGPTDAGRGGGIGNSAASTLAGNGAVPLAPPPLPPPLGAPFLPLGAAPFLATAGHPPPPLGPPQLQHTQSVFVDLHRGALALSRIPREAAIKYAHDLYQNLLLFGGAVVGAGAATAVGASVHPLPFPAAFAAAAAAATKIPDSSAGLTEESTAGPPAKKKPRVNDSGEGRKERRGKDTLESERGAAGAALPASLVQDEKHESEKEHGASLCEKPKVSVLEYKGSTKRKRSEDGDGDREATSSVEVSRLNSKDARESLSEGVSKAPSSETTAAVSAARTAIKAAEGTGSKVAAPGAAAVSVAPALQSLPATAPAVPTFPLPHMNAFNFGVPRQPPSFFPSPGAPMMWQHIVPMPAAATSLENNFVQEDLARRRRKLKAETERDVPPLVKAVILLYRNKASKHVLDESKSKVREDLDWVEPPRPEEVDEYEAEGGGEGKGDDATTEHESAGGASEQGKKKEGRTADGGASSHQRRRQRAKKYPFASSYQRMKEAAADFEVLLCAASGGRPDKAAHLLWSLLQRPGMEATDDALREKLYSTKTCGCGGRLNPLDELIVDGIREFLSYHPRSLAQPKHERYAVDIVELACMFAKPPPNAGSALSFQATTRRLGLPAYQIIHLSRIRKRAESMKKDGEKISPMPKKATRSDCLRPFSIRCVQEFCHSEESSMTFGEVGRRDRKSYVVVNSDTGEKERHGGRVWLDPTWELRYKRFRESEILRKFKETHENKTISMTVFRTSVCTCVKAMWKNVGDAEGDEEDIPDGKKEWC
eukprot:CAMPEP_0113537456 /NCGR_PEP_ID=MMETSP0015_2-20120614/6836_1 /TAXON_ID=2838 /ORGANISM="Odontella" /LENGTH=874 /DNA_ID=CAMNT_0000436953 /DNA_START=39 /DNA_END=2663 /DNA_ORIENTATION=- /assembly_acc=CAM_ASM_000160